MVWHSCPTASAGDRFKGSSIPPTVADGLWSPHAGQYMLYFPCHTGLVRLTEHLGGTHESGQKQILRMRNHWPYTPPDIGCLTLLMTSLSQALPIVL